MSKKNQEYYDFLERQSTTHKEHDSDGWTLEGSPFLCNEMSEPSSSQSVHRPFHVSTEEYTMVERPSKNSDAFCTLKLNFGKGTTGKSSFYLLLEYAPFRTLDHLTQTLHGLGCEKSKFYALEVASGLDFLHNNKIMHCDVKPENMFILVSGHVALGDFGSSQTTATTVGTNRICGTYVTRPPEVWASHRYDQSVDIWQLGISLYNVISNKWPIVHASKEKQIEMVRTGKIFFTQEFTEVAVDLITRMVQVDPAKRLTTQQVMRHKYFETLHEPYNPVYSPTDMLQLLDFGDQAKHIVHGLLMDIV